MKPGNIITLVILGLGMLLPLSSPSQTNKRPPTPEELARMPLVLPPPSQNGPGDNKGYNNNNNDSPLGVLGEMPARLRDRVEQFRASMRSNTTTARKLMSTARNDCSFGSSSDACVSAVTAAVSEVKAADEKLQAAEQAIVREERIIVRDGGQPFLNSSQFQSPEVESSKKEMHRLAGEINARVHEGDWSIEFSSGQIVSLGQASSAEGGAEFKGLTAKQKKAMMALLAEYKVVLDKGKELVAKKGAETLHQEPGSVQAMNNAEGAAKTGTNERSPASVGNTEIAAKENALNKFGLSTEDSFKLYFGSPIGMPLSSIWKMMNKRYSKTGNSLEP